MLQNSVTVFSFCMCELTDVQHWLVSLRLMGESEHAMLPINMASFVLPEKGGGGWGGVSKAVGSLADFC